MKPGFFQGKKFPFIPKRRKKSLGSQCNNIIDTRHDLAAFRTELANVSWLRSYKETIENQQLLVVERAKREITYHMSNKAPAHQPN